MKQSLVSCFLQWAEKDREKHNSGNHMLNSDRENISLLVLGSIAYISL